MTQANTLVAAGQGEMTASQARPRTLVLRRS
jgi:hypothetical protein